MPVDLVKCNGASHPFSVKSPADGVVLTPDFGQFATVGNRYNEVVLTGFAAVPGGIGAAFRGPQTKGDG